MKYSLFASAVVVAAACGGEMDDGAATPASGDPPSGFYALTIVTTDDTCTPARATGDRGTALVMADANGVNVPIPFVDGGPPRQDVPWAGTTLNDLADCPGTTLGLSIVHRSSDAFAVDVTERWRGVAACASSSSLLGVPSDECTATRRFEFTLVDACPATVDGASCP